MDSPKLSDARLLVVEDVDSLRKFLCEALELLDGIGEVVGVADGGNALQALEKIRSSTLY